MKKIMNYQLRENCRICNHKITKFLDLGETPLADSFPISPNIEEQKFPLQLAFCNDCNLVQLTVDVDSNLLFGKDYAFYSSGSPSSVEYFRRYVEDLLLRFPNQSKGLILEIGSNDGLLLKYLKDKGCRQVLGFDPAPNVAQDAIKRGIPTITALFNKNTAQKVPKKASIILANNVVAHIEDLDSFLEGVKLVLANDGVFIFEVQYLPQLIFNNQFDHVYHEHRSFFALRPLVRLLTRFDLGIFDVHQQYTQGGSIRVFVTHTTNSRKTDKSVSDIIQKELKLHLDSIETYQEFALRVEQIKTELIQMLQTLKGQSKKIYGFGASAKGNTLLNYCGIDQTFLNCIIDKTPFKFNKFTPGTHIPVFPPEKLVEIGYPDYYLLLVWNYLPGILEREMEFIKNGGHFIVPIPRPYVI